MLNRRLLRINSPYLVVIVHRYFEIASRLQVLSSKKDVSDFGIFQWVDSKVKHGPELSERRVSAHYVPFSA